MKRYFHKAPMALSVLAVMLLVALTPGCSQRRSTQFTEQGDTLLVLGNIEEATAAFERALAANPSNAEAKLGLARCQWAGKDGETAVRSYKEAIALNAQLDKAYIEGARIALAIKDTAKAEELAAQYLAVKPEPGGILRAYVLRETDRAGEAVGVLQQLREQFPRSVEVRVNFAAALLSAKQPAEAEKELKATLDELDSNSMPARMMLVEAYQQQGKLAEIEDEFRALAEQRPDDDAAQLALARSLLASKKLDEAEKLARPILERKPESPWANYVVGAYLLAQGKRDEALNCLQAASGALPDDPQISKLLAEAKGTAVARNAPSQTAPTTTTATESGEGPLTWQKLWRDGCLRQLLSGREAFLATNESNSGETLALAAVFIQDTQLAKQLGERLPADSPVAIYITALLARDAPAMRAHLEKWEETIPDRRVLRLNAEGFALAVAGARAHAMRVFSQCIQEYPDNGATYYNVASMFRGAAMPKFAIGTLKQLIARHADNREARQLLFDTMLEANLDDEARRQAESTFALFPEDAASLLNLARVYRDAGELGLAEDVLRRGIERVEDSTPLSLALMELQIARGDNDAATALLATLEKDPGHEQAQLLLTAFIAASKNNWDETLALCGQAVAPNYPLPTRLLHVAALAKTGKVAEAGEPLRMADGQPRSGPATNALIRALDVSDQSLDPQDEALASALKANPEALAFFAYGMACREMRFMRDAYTMFRAVDEKCPGQQRLVEHALLVAARSGDIDGRLASASHFTDKYPGMASAWIGLADVHASLDDAEAQKLALEKATEVEPANDQPWRRLAQFYSLRDDYPSLLQACRQIVAILPDDPYAGNNLAYCLLQTDGDAGEALALAQKASDKLPRNPEVVHTLGLAQIRTGDVEEGRKNLTAALEMRPGDPTLMLDYGELLINQNQADEGRTHIQLALRYANQLGLDFPRKSEAEKALADASS